MEPKKIWVFACLLLLTLTCCQAQDSTAAKVRARSAVYLEIGGTSAVYSLNYDLLFDDHHEWKFGGRLGLALLNLSLYDSRIVGELYALKGRNNHYLELGLGSLYRAQRQLTVQQMLNGRLVETSSIKEPSAISLVPRIGYRFQKPTQGLVFRVGFTPLIFREQGQFTITPWGGLSIGRTF